MEDRREPRPDTPLGYLQRLPASILLDRLPVPILAVHLDGTIVHANPAFEDMLGFEQNAVVGRETADVLAAILADDTTAIEYLRGAAGDIISLVAEDGSTVRAVVSESVFTRKDDPVALVCFHDVTEQLWDAKRISTTPSYRGRDA
ncbi:PAS domain S-box protein [Antrihabitans cavernicola]|uniref:PAS domain S-box protein n=1 Tax=Antrihabitans cavernicola TaxID=2495913 RepID=A0A5A7SEV4_9NOCA|nr:PAS domain-containing protein [Spelaeibacter cavernicola]KAA0023959.1 PAS domain S-box protein [Spelaeibacter cavernicola]